MIEASAISYHYGFDDCKERIVQVYLDLDLKGIVIIEEGAEKGEIREADAEEAILPALEEASAKEAV